MYITVRDQVVLPLLQGTLWTLALSGWRYWNRGAQFAGESIGSKIRRWWWGVNGWDMPASRGRKEAALAGRVGEVSLFTTNTIDMVDITCSFTKSSLVVLESIEGLSLREIMAYEVINSLEVEYSKSKQSGDNTRTNRLYLWVFESGCYVLTRPHSEPPYLATRTPRYLILPLFSFSMASLNPASLSSNVSIFGLMPWWAAKLNMSSCSAREATKLECKLYPSKNNGHDLCYVRLGQSKDEGLDLKIKLTADEYLHEVRPRVQRYPAWQAHSS